MTPSEKGQLKTVSTFFFYLCVFILNDSASITWTEKPVYNVYGSATNELSISYVKSIYQISKH